MAQTPAFITFDDVSFMYKGRDGMHSVFDRLNLTIDRHEIVTVFGPSGTGKSTLAHLLAGYITPDSGSIRIDGRVHTKPSKHCIVINQETDIFGWLTVRQNLDLVTPDAKRIEKYIKLVSLDTVANSWASDLSGGMKKRLSFARALCSGASLLVLDESFSSLDYPLRQKLYKELLTIAKKEHKTVIIITHDIDEAIHLSDRIVILSPKTKKVKSVISLSGMKSRSSPSYLMSSEGQFLIKQIRKEIQ